MHEKLVVRTEWLDLNAQVWTYKERVAFVLSVTEKGKPVADGVKLSRLRQLVYERMNTDNDALVNIKQVSTFST